ncbi:MAG: substrate-binding domain-containing protein [Myxococcota bacterium]
MSNPRVLVILDAGAAWSRGILLGFMSIAHERGWELLHYHASTDLDWLANEWAPAAAVVGPELRSTNLAQLPSCPVVFVNCDRSAEGLASACLDEAAVAALAVEHLRGRGLQHLTTFRFDDSPFAVARDAAFCERAIASGAQIAPGWWHEGAESPRQYEVPHALMKWLRELPKPCGLFTCADVWGRVVARYARAAGLRIPEDLALVGVDNDVVECELIVPALSSVAVPWRELGRKAADLVQLALGGTTISGQRSLVQPIDVQARRSSDVLAVTDELTAQAVAWIRAHADRRLTVPVVARAVASSSQRLERHFRSSLGRTVQEEIRRAHVEAAKHVLASTELGLPEVARRSGFSSAALLSVAFQRELGMPPGAYRRRMQEARVDGEIATLGAEPNSDLR